MWVDQNRSLPYTESFLSFSCCCNFPLRKIYVQTKVYISVHVHYWFLDYQTLILQMFKSYDYTSLNVVFEQDVCLNWFIMNPFCQGQDLFFQSWLFLKNICFKMCFNHAKWVNESFWYWQMFTLLSFSGSVFKSLNRPSLLRFTSHSFSRSLFKSANLQSWLKFAQHTFTISVESVSSVIPVSPVWAYSVSARNFQK